LEKERRERMGKRRKGKEQEKGKRNEQQIFVSFSLLVDIGGFISGVSDCAILHDEGQLFLFNIPFFPSGSNGSP
jgi:hypothetical protein